VLQWPYLVRETIATPFYLCDMPMLTPFFRDVCFWQKRHLVSLVAFGHAKWQGNPSDIVMSIMSGISGAHDCPHVLFAVYFVLDHTPIIFIFDMRRNASCVRSTDSCNNTSSSLIHTVFLALARDVCWLTIVWYLLPLQKINWFK
jgi:hypothetical protein